MRTIISILFQIDDLYSSEIYRLINLCSLDFNSGNLRVLKIEKSWQLHTML